MKLKICAIYCICDDYLKEIGSIAWHNEKMKDSEVITSLIVAAQFFGGCIEKARVFLLDHKYIPDMLSKSRLIERIHKISPKIFPGLLRFMRNYTPLKSLKCCIVDSFPIAICKNVRILRSRLVKGKAYHGYNASKKEFYYGYKGSLITCENGLPIDLQLEPASKHDLNILKETPINFIKKGSMLVGDGAYLSKAYKEQLEEKGIELITAKRSNSKLWPSLREWKILKGVRKIIETSISSITALMPKAIKAVTSKGFKIKIFAFVLAFSFSKLNY